MSFSRDSPSTNETHSDTNIQRDNSTIGDVFPTTTSHIPPEINFHALFDHPPSPSPNPSTLLPRQHHGSHHSSKHSATTTSSTTPTSTPPSHPSISHHHAAFSPHQQQLPAPPLQSPFNLFPSPDPAPPPPSHPQMNVSNPTTRSSTRWQVSPEDSITRRFKSWELAGSTFVFIMALLSIAAALVYRWRSATTLGPAHSSVFEVMKLIALPAFLWIRVIQFLILPLVWLNTMSCVYNLQGTKTYLSHIRHSIAFFILTAVAATSLSVMAYFILFLPTSTPFDVLPTLNDWLDYPFRSEFNPLLQLHASSTPSPPPPRPSLHLQAPIIQAQSIFWDVFPTNAVAPLLTDNILGTVLLGVLIALAMSQRKTSYYHSTIEEMTLMFNQLYIKILALLPFFVFSLLFPRLCMVDLTKLGLSFAWYSLVLGSVTLCHAVVILPLGFWMFNRFRNNPYKIAYNATRLLLTALRTTSASDPVTIQQTISFCIKSENIKPGIAKLMIPITRRISIDCTMISLPIAFWYLTFTTGIELSYGEIISSILICIVLGVCLPVFPFFDILKVVILAKDKAIELTGIAILVILVNSLLQPIFAALGTLSNVFACHIVNTHTQNSKKLKFPGLLERGVNPYDSLQPPADQNDPFNLHHTLQHPSPRYLQHRHTYDHQPNPPRQRPSSNIQSVSHLRHKLRRVAMRKSKGYGSVMQPVSPYVRAFTYQQRLQMYRLSTTTNPNTPHHNSPRQPHYSQSHAHPNPSPHTQQQSTSSPIPPSHGSTSVPPQFGRSVHDNQQYNTPSQQSHDQKYKRIPLPASVLIPPPQPPITTPSTANHQLPQIRQPKHNPLLESLQRSLDDISHRNETLCAILSPYIRKLPLTQPISTHSLSIPQPILSSVCTLLPPLRPVTLFDFAPQMVLGKGAFGLVLYALHNFSGQPYALKIFNTTTQNSNPQAGGPGGGGGGGGGADNNQNNVDINNQPPPTPHIHPNNTNINNEHNNAAIHNKNNHTNLDATTDAIHNAALSHQLSNNNFGLNFDTNVALQHGIREIDALECLDHPNIISLHGSLYLFSDVSKSSHFSPLLQLFSTCLQQHSSTSPQLYNIQPSNQHPPQPHHSPQQVSPPLQFPSLSSPTCNELVLILDYFHEGDLYHFLSRSGPLAIPTVQNIAAQIFLALDYIHSRGLIFRDLKPENLLVLNGSHIILSDFGLTKICDLPNPHSSSDPARISIQNHKDKASKFKNGTSLVAKSFVGTPEYIASEIIISRGFYTHSVDYYAAGVLLYELLTGNPPHYHTNKNRLFHKTLHETPNYPAYLPQICQSFLQELLCKQGDRRMSSLTQVQNHPFFAFVEWDNVLYTSQLTMLQYEYNYRFGQTTQKKQQQQQIKERNEVELGNQQNQPTQPNAMYKPNPQHQHFSNVHGDIISHHSLLQQLIILFIYVQQGKIYLAIEKLTQYSNPSRFPLTPSLLCISHLITWLNKRETMLHFLSPLNAGEADIFQQCLDYISSCSCPYCQYSLKVQYILQTTTSSQQSYLNSDIASVSLDRFPDDFFEITSTGQCKGPLTLLQLENESKDHIQQIRQQHQQQQQQQQQQQRRQRPHQSHQRPSLTKSSNNPTIKGSNVGFNDITLQTIDEVDLDGVLIQHTPSHSTDSAPVDYTQRNSEVLLRQPSISTNVQPNNNLNSSSSPQSHSEQSLLEYHIDGPFIFLLPLLGPQNAYPQPAKPVESQPPPLSTRTKGSTPRKRHISFKRSETYTNIDDDQINYDDDDNDNDGEDGSVFSSSLRTGSNKSQNKSAKEILAMCEANSSDSDGCDSGNIDSLTQLHHTSQQQQQQHQSTQHLSFSIYLTHPTQVYLSLFYNHPISVHNFDFPSLPISSLTSHFRALRDSKLCSHIPAPSFDHQQCHGIGIDIGVWFGLNSEAVLKVKQSKFISSLSSFISTTSANKPQPATPVSVFDHESNSILDFLTIFAGHIIAQQQSQFQQQQQMTPPQQAQLQQPGPPSHPQAQQNAQIGPTLNEYQSLKESLHLVTQTLNQQQQYIAMLLHQQQYMLNQQQQQQQQQQHNAPEQSQLLHLDESIHLPHPQ